MSSPSTMTTTGAISLTDAQLATLRDLLVAEHATEEANLLEHRATMRDLTGHSDVDSILEREVAEAAARRSGEAIDDIAASLARLETGTYGSCEKCGSSIAFERLEVIPQSRRCAACSERSRGLLG